MGKFEDTIHLSFISISVKNCSLTQGIQCLLVVGETDPRSYWCAEISAAQFKELKNIYYFCTVSYDLKDENIAIIRSFLAFWFIFLWVTFLISHMKSRIIKITLISLTRKFLTYKLNKFKVDETKVWQTKKNTQSIVRRGNTLWHHRLQQSMNPNL